MPLTRKIAHDDFLWLLRSLGTLFRVDIDPQRVAAAFPPPSSIATLNEAASALGLTMQSGDAGSADWLRVTLPAVAFVREPRASIVEPKTGSDDDRSCHPEASGSTTDGPPLRALLIVRTDGERLLYFRSDASSSLTMAASDALHLLEPGLVTFSRNESKAEATSGDDADCAPRPVPRFGFRWFLPELWKHRRIWRDVLLASLAIQLVALATPLFTQVIVDKVVVHQTHSTLVVLGSALGMFLLFTAAMNWLRQYLILHTGNRVDAVLGSAVFDHLLRLPLPHFEQRSTGSLVARLHGVETIREFISGTAVTLVLDLPFLLIFLAVMLAYSWQLSLIAVALLAGIAACSALVTPLFRRRLDRQFTLGARNQSFLTEYISGMGTVKALQMEPTLGRKYELLLARWLAAGFATRQTANTYQVIANALEQTMTLAILVVGAMMVMRNDGFTIGMLVAFQMFASRLSQPLLRLTGLWQEFQQADVAVRRLGDILNLPPEPHDVRRRRSSVSETAGSAGLELRDIAFRYSDRDPWLYRKLDLRFPAGRLTVVAGPSGSGKSTLAKLLLGFHQPDEGSIHLDGTDIRHLAANELRSTFGVVPQETVLFSGTVYENLALANPEAGFDDIVTACKAAEIHAAIEQLPQGYQTVIGERGAGLSGGQKQRIAIARALLKRPRILIFDEAVSNLDQPTAELFARTINQLRGRATMIFITHHVPRGLEVDELVTLGRPPARAPIEVVEANEPGEARCVR